MCVFVLIKFRLFLVWLENDITEIDDAPHAVRSFRQILFHISPHPKIKNSTHLSTYTTPGGEITPVRYYATHATRKNTTKTRGVLDSRNL